MKRKFIICFLWSGLLMGCSTNNKTEEGGKEKEAKVFIMCGQSNMEGNTNFSRLNQFCADSDEHDYNSYKEGFSNVKISFYNHYDKNNHNYSNITNPTEGLFVDAGLNQGVRVSNFSGPEVGLAERLNDFASEDEPIFLIKYTSGGTGFLNTTRDGNGNWNWMSTSNKNPGYLYTSMCEFVQTNLDLIEEEYNIKPTIKGFLWMQGEHDACNATYAPLYGKNLKNMITDFREEFKDYASNSDGNNIAFIDAEIADNGTLAYAYMINNLKAQLALEDNNYLIKTNSEGLDLKVGSEEHGGGDMYHYTIDSMIRLGNAYGDTIIEEGLLK